MTIFVEVCGPFLWKPGHFNSRIMRRFWWGYVAIGWLHIPLPEFGKNSYVWLEKSPPKRVVEIEDEASSLRVRGTDYTWRERNKNPGQVDP